MNILIILLYFMTTILANLNYYQGPRRDFWSPSYYRTRAKNHRSQNYHRDHHRRRSAPINAAGFFYMTADYDPPPAEDFNRESEEIENNNKAVNGDGGDDCSLYPNGTYSAPYAFSCSNPLRGPPLFVVHDSALANRAGRYVYPVDSGGGGIRIFLDMTNYGTKSYNAIRTEVALFRRRVGWMGCGWVPIPTFGALDSEEICEDNNSCPVYPGRQVLEFRLEPSQVFMAMLRMVLNDNKPPYEMRLRLVNNRDRGEELTCVAFQTRLKI